jgi:hypothetical protein
MTTPENAHDIFYDRMVKEYPDIFSQPFGGFAVGEGWFPIIEALVKMIDSRQRWLKEVSARFPDKYKAASPVVVSQIKEKFGGLRFYYDGGDEYISGLAAMAEVWADRSCEECGSPGTRRGGGWIRTLCDHHEAERQARMKKNFGDEA